MKQLLKKARKISMFVLVITLLGCINDDGAIFPKAVSGYTFTLNGDTGTVTFINTSEDARTYLWTFSDGTTSTEINPIKTFESGTYTVTLEVSNVAGATDTFEDTFTILIEDSTPIIPGTLALPVTFDDSAVDYVGSIDGSFSVVDNPALGGVNDVASKVGAIENAGEQWEATVATLDTPVDFSTNKTITVKLWSESVLPILLKFEGGVNGERENEVVVNHGGTGWEELSFDFATNATKSFIDGNQGVGDAFVPTGQYATIVIFVDGPGTTAGTFYIDDIEQIASTGGGGDCTTETAQSLSAADFNLTFQTDPTASIDSFDAGLSWADNPDVDVANNGSCKVGQIDRIGSALFANNQIDLDAKFDFSANAGFTMKVWSPVAGTNILVKLEDQADAGIFTEIGAITTTASTWEELTFPIASSENGKYDKIILFFELNTNTTETYYIDDFALYAREGGGTGEGNLITNGGFETGDASGWETAIAGNSGTFAVTSASAKCDTYSANIAVNEAQLQIIRQANIGVGVVTPDSEITVSFDLRGTTGDGGEFVTILFSESTTEGVTKTDNLDGPLIPTDTWTRYTFTTTTGPDVSNGVTLLLQSVCGAVAGCELDAYIDNVFIAMGSTGGPECNGNNGGDSVAPIITLIGDATVNLAVGASYTDAGASAEDNVDGDISGNIVVGGDTVDTNVAGTYTITYNVSDAAGNAATQVTRTVVVSVAGECTPETTESLNAANFDLTFMSDQTANIIEDGGDFEYVSNPDVDITINPSCFVGKITKLGNNPWDNNQIDLNAKLDFNANAGFKVKVYSAVAGFKVLLKLEEIGNAGNNVELEVTTTKTNEWEELTFPFASSESNQYDKIVLFFDLNANNTDTYYFDDLALYGGGGGDSVAPIITLIGDATVNLAVGASYTDAGASANDNVDGDISGNIMVGGDTVDTNTEGAYTITYNVSDAAGNAATQVTRRVNVGVDASGELITNGDFEAGDASWQLFDGASISTTVNNGGSNSAEIQGIPGPARGIKQERFAVGTILPNTTYTVSFDIIASGPLGIGGLVKSFAFSEGADGGSVPATLHTITDNLENISTTSWQTVTNTFTTPGNANQVEGGLSFLIEIVNSTDSAIINIDNVSIKLDN